MSKACDKQYIKPDLIFDGKQVHARNRRNDVKIDASIEQNKAR